MNKVHKRILQRADIVICSYHPDDGQLASQRMAFLIAQIGILNKKFRTADICVITSNWTDVARAAIDDVAPTLIYDAIHLEGQVYKAEKHNMVMRAIKGMSNKSVLILGDDVVPTRMDGIRLNPFGQITKWLTHPSDMPAPCIFFSCKGTLRDTYYKERMKKGQRFSNTAAVTDWAFMIRSEFQCLLEKEEMELFVPNPPMMKGINRTWQLNSDAMLRFKAASLGYEVLKDQNLFFETFQSTSSDKNSVWYHNRESRRKGVLITNEVVSKAWPWLFQGNKPIWQLRGQRADKLVRLGLLHEGKYGLYPNGPALKQRWEQKQIQKNSLTDLL